MDNVIELEKISVVQKKNFLERGWPDFLTWLKYWEIYPIILVAGFLRFYRLDSASFDIDQADVYRMAYDAVHHGLLPVTANFSSLGELNPPAVLYIYMIPAALSADPLSGIIMIALLTTIAIFIAYLFVCRYYGRFTAAISALLYASLTTLVGYSRLIWNQNLLILLTPLFLLFLFRGAVDRRKGWFVPSVCLIGLMIQLHSSSILMVVLLLVAVVMAPGTVRWRELGYASLALLILYSPYLIWEIHDRFGDIHTIWYASKQTSHIDDQALLWYQSFLAGYIPVNPASPIYPLHLLIRAINILLTPLLIAGTILVLFQVFLPMKNGKQGKVQDQILSSFWTRSKQWWQSFRSDTYRCGLLLLLIWQVVPLIVLSRHAIPVYQSYFIYLMPGQFILIAFLFAQIKRWLQRFQNWQRVGRYALYFVVFVIIATQALASLGYVVDLARGNISDSHYGLDYHYKLSDLQSALNEAEQLAQRQHIKHIYVSAYADYYHLSPLTYLAEHTQIPTTVFTDNCLVLPDPTDGPAVLLEGPYNTLTDTLLSSFASATLIAKPADRGASDSFKLFIVKGLPVTGNGQVTALTSAKELQPLDMQPISSQNTSWMVTRWQILHSEPTSYRKAYVYSINDSAQPANNQQCLLTSMQAGDQLLRAFPVLQPNQKLTQLNASVETSTILPLIWRPGWFHLTNLAFETGAYETNQLSKENFIFSTLRSS